VITVSIIEDEPDIRSLMVALLSGTEDLTFLREYGSAEEALQDLPTNKPTVIMVDIGLPGMSGIECAAHIHALYPDVQIMMSTILDDDDNIMNALKSGASGYILKSSARPGKILESIHDLALGGSAMSPEIARKVITTFRQPVRVQPPCLHSHHVSGKCWNGWQEGCSMPKSPTNSSSISAQYNATFTTSMKNCTSGRGRKQ
jgi:DNA-binding NarL/FixJ family response regulator